MAPSEIQIFEVGPRDGLQNEPTILPLQEKVAFVRGLVEAGLRDIEIGAFVRPDRVPQMAESGKLFEEIQRGALQPGQARMWCLVPNLRGLRDAWASGARNFAVFTAATESFTKRNIGMSISESLKEFSEVIQEARALAGANAKIQLRGYVSTAFGCPFEGKVAAKSALPVIEKLAALGVDQISIGDTIGVATPKQVEELVRPALAALGPDRIALHFHDTRGTALANALRAMELGVKNLDSSAGGLGGCPFAPGASGNLATEDLVYMLEGMGIRTGVDLKRLCEASLELSRRMSRPLSSRYLQAYSVQNGACVKI